MQHSPEPSGKSAVIATPEIAKRVDSGQLTQFVTTIKSAEHQIGENIIGALHHEDTVAVLTTVVVGNDGKQHVVSAALSPDLMEEVQGLLKRAAEERDEEVPCIGFHCLIQPKSGNRSSDQDAPSPENDARKTP